MAMTHSQKIDDILEISRKRDIAIYGTSQMAIDFCQILIDNKLDILCFLDDSPTDDRIIGFPVYSIYDFLLTDLRDLYIVVVRPEDDFPARIRPLFLSLGLRPDVNFNSRFNDLLYVEEWRKPILLDIDLGHTKSGDLPGYNLFGNVSNPEAQIIVTLGGGAVDAYDAQYVKSWPEYLYYMISADMDDIVMYNGGVNGYSSPQLVQKLIRDILPLQPRLVIVYGGFDDAYYFPRPQTRRWRHPFVSETLERIYSFAEFEKEFISFGLENVTSPADFWIDNMRTMHAIAEEFKFSFFSILQPNIFTSQILRSEKELKRLSLSLMRSYHNEMTFTDFVSEVRDSVAAYDYIWDYTSVFDGLGGVYWDHNHLTGRGGELIAMNIYENLQCRGIL